MDLEDLEDLFDDLEIEGPTPNQLYQMYGVFLQDIARNPIIMNGKQVKFNSNKSKHPICKGKALAFEHIITRESRISGRRDFDRERANKIHWIRPILLNAGDVRIKCFEKTNYKGQNQQYYWFEEKSFVVILREIQSDLFLITAFLVDRIERLKFRRWYEEYGN